MSAAALPAAKADAPAEADVRADGRGATPRAAPPQGRAGVFWSGLNGVASVVLPFAVFAGFARWLGPAQFALFGLTIAALELLKTLAPQGLYDVLVTHDETQAAYHESAAALFLGSALAVMAGFVLVLAASGSLFGLHMPAVAYGLVLKILFDFLLLQPQAALVRRHDVRRLGMRGLMAGSVAALCGAGLALVSPGLGLVGFYVVQSAALFATTVVGTGAWARPRLHRKAAGAMLDQGLRASGVRLCAGAINYLDQLVIGRMFSAHAIGFYNLGKRLEVVSITMAASFSQILWQPGFATQQAEQHHKALARAVASVALVCGVPAALLAVLHRQAIPFVFGANWAGAARVAALLAVCGAFRALGSVAGAVFSVTARNGLLMGVSVFSAVSNLALIFVMARYGLEMAALAVCLRNGAQAFANFWLLKEARGAAAGLIWHNFLWPLALVAAACGLADWALAPVFAAAPALLRAFVELSVSSLAGVAVAAALLLKRI